MFHVAPTITSMAASQIMLNNNNLRYGRRGCSSSSNSSPNRNKTSIPKWKKIGSKIIFVFLILYSLFGIKACSDIKDFRYNEIPVEFTVTGYHEHTRKHKSHYHEELYVFLHNDKLGDYTFNVTPKTYYDASHGQKKMTFINSYYDLKFKADNNSTIEKLKSNYEMFGLKEHVVKWFNFLDNFCVLGMTLGFGALLIFYLSIFVYIDDSTFNDSILIKINVIVWILSLIIMFISSIT